MYGLEYQHWLSHQKFKSALLAICCICSMRCESIPVSILLNTEYHFMSLVLHPSLKQGDPPEVPEELVPRGFCVIHSGGLHLPHGGQSGL